MITNQYGVWQPIKERHDGTSSPIQNGWHRNAPPSSVSRLRGPSRGDWPEVVAGNSDFVASLDRHASVKKASSPGIKNTNSCQENIGSPTVTCNSQNQAGTSDNARLTKSIMRAARLRDLLAAVEEWRRASGPDRTYWRRDARHRLAEWRTLYRIPERAAFQAAVARSQAARP